MEIHVDNASDVANIKLRVGSKNRQKKSRTVKNQNHVSLFVLLEITFESNEIMIYFLLDLFNQLHSHVSVFLFYFSSFLSVPFCDVFVMFFVLLKYSFFLSPVRTDP